MLTYFENKKTWAYLIFAGLSLALSTWLQPILSAAVFCFIVWNFFPNFKGRNILFTAIILIGGFWTVLYLDVVINWINGRTPSWELFPSFIFWVTEAFHFAIMIIMFVGIYRIIFKPLAPYSALYVGIYHLVHSLYNGCPLSELQNYVSLQAGIEPIDNIFWRGLFGQDPNVLNAMRVLVGLICLTLIYYSYKVFMLIPVQDWPTAWKLKSSDLQKKYL